MADEDISEERCNLTYDFKNKMYREQNNTILSAPTCAGQVRCLMADLISAQVGTPAMANIDREITPLITELSTLGSGNLEHPTAIQLYRWLIEPHRSAEEFNYVIGPLERHIHFIMMSYFKPYISKSFRRGSKIVGKIAAEALAVRCPILEGSWETAGWFIVNLNKMYRDPFGEQINGFATDQLTTWLIWAIGDPAICPSSYLRIEFIHLLIMMVTINHQTKIPALDSVMSAFSSLNLEYLEGGQHTGFFNMDFNAIFDTLELFAAKGYNQYLYKVDKQVAEKLKNVSNMRHSVMLKDVAYNHSVNPSRYNEPRELNSLIALLKITNGRVKVEWDRFQDEGLYDAQWSYLEPLSRAIHVLIMSFKSTFGTPQLMEVASLCVMDLLELVLLVNVALWEDQRELYHKTLKNTNDLLEELFELDDRDSNTNVGREIICNVDRLRKFKEKWQHVSHYIIPTFYPMISCLINHDCRFLKLLK